jgi:hypothetical protein
MRPVPIGIPDSATPAARSATREWTSDAYARQRVTCALLHDAHNLLDGDRFAKDVGDMEIREILGRPRDDDNRNVAQQHLSADILPHRHAIEVRQTEIKQYEVGGRAVEEPQCLESISRLDNGEPLEA